MDVFVALKSLILGIIWTGSFYLIAAYLLPLFPMPALLYIRKGLQRWSDNIAWLDEAKAERRWQRSKGLFRFLVGLLWLGLMAACAYLLLPVLQLLVGMDDPYFWKYYSIALLLPFIYLFYLGIKIFRDAAKSRKEPIEIDNRPALERIKQPLI